jgi:hypothetical protein
MFLIGIYHLLTKQDAFLGLQWFATGDLPFPPKISVKTFYVGPGIECKFRPCINYMKPNQPKTGSSRTPKLSGKEIKIRRAIGTVTLILKKDNDGVYVAWADIGMESQADEVIKTGIIFDATTAIYKIHRSGSRAQSFARAELFMPRYIPGMPVRSMHLGGGKKIVVPRPSDIIDDTDALQINTTLALVDFDGRYAARLAHDQDKWVASADDDSTWRVKSGRTSSRLSDIRRLPAGGIPYNKLARELVVKPYLLRYAIAMEAAGVRTIYTENVREILNPAEEAVQPTQAAQERKAHDRRQVARAA